MRFLETLVSVVAEVLTRYPGTHKLQSRALSTRERFILDIVVLRIILSRCLGKVLVVFILKLVQLLLLLLAGNA